MISGEEKLPTTYWLTRDRTCGELSNRIDVWSARPERVRYDDGDVFWQGNGDTCVTFWKYIDALKRVGPGVPETDRECTRVGPEPELVVYT